MNSGKLCQFFDTEMIKKKVPFILNSSLFLAFPLLPLQLENVSYATVISKRVFANCTSPKNTSLDVNPQGFFPPYSLDVFGLGSYRTDADICI